MICSECNHMLPDDSEFCQYCGKRLEKHVSIQENSVVENEEKVIVTDEIIETAKPVLHNLEDTTPEEPVKAIIKIQTEETSKKLKESKKLKNRFCKFCGGQIDIQTKKCSGCGKQYFKGIKFNKFLTTALILSLVIITSVIFNIIQFVEINKINEEKDYYKKKTTEQQTQISNLNIKIKEKDDDLDFYLKYAVIVNDNSKKYHAHGCGDLGDSSFRIYNISQAQNLGYSACSKCNPGKTASQKALEEWHKKYGVGQ